MDDDRAVIARVQAGATDAFRVLVDRYQHVVWTFCRNLLRQPADAEDLTQDVFLVAFRKLSSYDADRAAFSTWLLTIARSRCCNRLQQRQPMNESSEEPLDRGPAPDETLADSEVWNRLDRALEQLPLEQRTAFVLAEIQELPHSEIAEIEGVEVGTVKSRVSRAKARLRDVLHAWSLETASVPVRKPT
ncbi:MAG: sigma-70 family RNA polymerase sigma factor [Planctomycetaceae bacterium]|nr:sigma-70 family RNA polymerase sigma factor [Planctomycetaceae bacterium]